MNNYKELEEIRHQLEEVMSPLARIVLTNYGPGAAPKYEDIQPVIASTIAKTLQLEQRILQIEQQIVETNQDENFRKKAVQDELERMTEAEQVWEDKKTEFIMH